MSRAVGISLQPLALDKGARDALRLADSFDDALDSLAGLPLGGLPPVARGRVGQTIAHARQSVRDAGIEARGQGAELRRRAALARAADEGGGSGFGAAVDFAFKQWGRTEHARNSLDVTAGIMGKLSKLALGSKRDAPLTPSMRSLLNRFAQHAKDIKRWTPWSRPTLPITLPGGLLKLSRPLARKVPAVGSTLDVISNIHSGMELSEVALRAVKDYGVQAGAVALGTAACGVFIVGTAGLAAAACPLVVGTALAVGGKIGSDYAFDKGKKAIEDAAARDRARHEREREHRDALRRHPSGRCEIEHAQARPLL